MTWLRAKTKKTMSTLTTITTMSTTPNMTITTSHNHDQHNHHIQHDHHDKHDHHDHQDHHDHCNHNDHGDKKEVGGIPHICHFFYTGRIFENQILHPKKRLKAKKTLKMSLKKSNICIFSLNLEKFTPDLIFVTGTACGACDKYEVCLSIYSPTMSLSVEVKYL